MDALFGHLKKIKDHRIRTYQFENLALDRQLYIIAESENSYFIKLLPLGTTGNTLHNAMSFFPSEIIEEIPNYHGTLDTFVTYRYLIDSEINIKGDLNNENKDSIEKKIKDTYSDVIKVKILLPKE
jgi:hypothetical protein